MLKYVVSRALPSRETLEQLKAHPSAYGTWGQLSQGQRIVRWLLARPARQLTLQPVRAALRAG
jgi:hypothetical protein